MFKKTIIALGLLGMAVLSGCVVVPRHGPVVYVDPAPAVYVGPIVPVFGWYGGYYHGYGGYRGGYGGGHWR